MNSPQLYPGLVCFGKTDIERDFGFTLLFSRYPIRMQPCFQLASISSRAAAWTGALVEMKILGHHLAPPGLWHAAALQRWIMFSLSDGWCSKEKVVSSDSVPGIWWFGKGCTFCSHTRCKEIAEEIYNAEFTTSIWAGQGIRKAFPRFKFQYFVPPHICYIVS